MAETARWALPLLDAGQAQKEMRVNEALARLDLLAQASVVAVGVNTPPASPGEGQCWIVGTAPTGVWAGQGAALAGWTGGGWRFAAAREGMGVWSAADGAWAVRAGGQWRVGAVTAISEPVGGTTVDVEARAALTQVLAALRGHGLIAS